MKSSRDGVLESHVGRGGRHTPPCAGFTLMELVVVVMFIGLIMAGVIPLYRDSVRNMRIERGISDLVAVIKYAQERAVTDGREFRVYLDQDTHRYWLGGFAGLNEDGEQVYQREAGARGGGGTLPPHLRFSRINAQQETMDRVHFIAFHPCGTSDVARLVIEQSERGRPFRIEVLGRMGRVEVEDPRS